MDFDISNINFTQGQTKKQIQAPDEQKVFINTVFDIFDKDKNGELDENEIKRFEKAKEETYLQGVALANPKYQKKIIKLEKNLQKIHGELIEYEHKLREMDNNGQHETKDYKKVTEKYLKRVKNRENLVAEIFYLSEVEVPKNISDKQINMNAQRYMQQRNQQNPYYNEWKETGRKMDLEPDPKKRQELLDKWLILENLVANWRPNITQDETSAYSSYQINNNYKISENAESNSFGLNFNKQLANHNLGVGANFTKGSSDNKYGHTENQNISANLFDTLSIGQNSTITGSLNFTNDKTETQMTIDPQMASSLILQGIDPEIFNKNTTYSFTPSLRTNTNIENFSIGAGYNLYYSNTTNKTTGIMQNEVSGGTRLQTGNVDIGFNKGIFNSRTGLTVSHLNGQKGSNFSLPLTVGVNLKGFNVAQTVTRNFANQEGWNYNTQLGYNLSKKNYSLYLNENLNYNKPEEGKEFLSLSSNAGIRNNKGTEMSVQYTRTLQKGNNGYNFETKFTGKVSDRITLSLSGGYGKQEKLSGQIGVSANLDPKPKPRNKHKPIQ